MKWKPLLFIGLAALLAIAFGATAILPFASQRKNPPPPAEAPASDAPAKAATPAYTPEEIFRRAFWRHPAPDDRIVQAERREQTDPDDGVKSWQWFLQVEPGPELLAALRNPATFGLMPTAIPRFPGARASAPLWFPPAINNSIDYEILQNPAGGLLIFYNKTRNTLYATDAGAGFAPPVTRNGERREL